MINVKYILMFCGLIRLPDIQNALELSQFRLGLELQQLVATFSLGPSNICLHATQWSLVSLIVIKL